MLTTALVAIALILWSIRLLERGWSSGDGTLLFAGILVMISAAAVVFVHAQLARVFTL